MNGKLLALFPLVLSASRFSTSSSSSSSSSFYSFSSSSFSSSSSSSSSEEIAAVEANESVNQPKTVAIEQEDPETEADAWYKRIMAYKEDPEEIAERRRLAQAEMAPSPRVVEVIQRIKYINSIYGQQVEELHPLELLRIRQAMEESYEDRSSPFSNFELTYGIAGEMLPVYERYVNSIGK